MHCWWFFILCPRRQSWTPTRLCLHFRGATRILRRFYESASKGLDRRLQAWQMCDWRLYGDTHQQTWPSSNRPILRNTSEIERERVLVSKRHKNKQTTTPAWQLTVRLEANASIQSQWLGREAFPTPRGATCPECWCALWRCGKCDMQSPPDIRRIDAQPIEV